MALISFSLIAFNHQLTMVNLGFNPVQLTSIRIRPPLPQYANARLRADLYRRLVDAVEAVPGVESVSLANHTPGGGLIYSPLLVEGLAEASTTGFKTIAPDYFETMGIALVEGRSFTDLDMTEHTDGLIINQSLARVSDEFASNAGKVLHYRLEGNSWNLVGTLAPPTLAAESER